MPYLKPVRIWLEASWAERDLPIELALTLFFECNTVAVLLLFSLKALNKGSLLDPLSPPASPHKHKHTQNTSLV
jgi:hypothetical protein